MSEYRYTINTLSGYETLVGPNDVQLAVLTEPEDRSFGRDLSPVLDELNRLRIERDVRKEVFDTLYADAKRYRLALHQIVETYRNGDVFDSYKIACDALNALRGT